MSCTWGKLVFMKVGIVGRKKDTKAYESFLTDLKISHITSLSLGDLFSCDAFLFPGGGDITPELFGESNLGSLHIDTELDILQLQAFHYAIKKKLPVLGICKGMQLINVGLGGTLIQNLSTASLHTSPDQDVYHPTVITPNSFLHALYGDGVIVNSRHHQALGKLGTNLVPVQWCPTDSCIEAIEHTRLPIWGIQWHPERIDNTLTSVNSAVLLRYFLSFA